MADTPNSDNRAHPRLEIAMPCVIEGPDFSGNATTSDISQGGMGITPIFPVDGRIAFAIRAITIEGVGRFAVTTRWVSNNRIGFSFTNPHAARQLLRNKAGVLGLSESFWAR